MKWRVYWGDGAFSEVEAETSDQARDRARKDWGGGRIVKVKPCKETIRAKLPPGGLTAYGAAGS